MRLTIEKVKNGYLLMVDVSIYGPGPGAAWAPLYDAMLEKQVAILDERADPEMARIRQENGEQPATSVTADYQSKLAAQEAQNPSGTYIFATSAEAIIEATKILERYEKK